MDALFCQGIFYYPPFSTLFGRKDFVPAGICLPVLFQPRDECYIEVHANLSGHAQLGVTLAAWLKKIKIEEWIEGWKGDQGNHPCLNFELLLSVQHIV